VTGELVRYTLGDRVAGIELSRPDRANRFNHTMMRSLAEAFMRATEHGVDVVVLTAAGDDFSVGRERDEVLPEGMTKADNTGLIVTVSHAMRDCPAIIVASVRGRALGFGCGLAVQSDFALAAETAQFGFNEIHHGSAPRFVMAYLEDYVGPKRALDLVVTGRTFGAAEAERYGMLTRVVDEDGLADSTGALVAELLERSPRAMRSCKSYLREVRGVERSERFAYALGQQVRAAR
jgi:enoyl-CoA hydratase/carnithine racemase